MRRGPAQRESTMLGRRDHLWLVRYSRPNGRVAERAFFEHRGASEFFLARWRERDQDPDGRSWPPVRMYRLAIAKITTVAPLSSTFAEARDRWYGPVIWRGGSSHVTPLADTLESDAESVESVVDGSPAEGLPSDPLDPARFAPEAPADHP